MPAALGQNEQLGYIMESVPGTTPSSALKEIRKVSVTPENTKETIESGETTLHGESTGSVMVARGGGLTFGFELTWQLIDDFLRSLFKNDFASDVLLPGTTRRTLTLERRFADLSRFHPYKKAQCRYLSIDVALKQAITGEAQFTSNPTVPAGATAGSGAYTAPNDEEMMAPIGSLQLLEEDGSPIIGCTEFGIQMNRGIIVQDQLTSVDPLDVLPGGFRCSGTFGRYFQGDTYLTKALAHTRTSLEIILGAAGSKQYQFFFPRVRLNEPEAPNEGQDTSIIEHYGWTAERDPDMGGTCRITRVMPSGS